MSGTLPRAFTRSSDKAYHRSAVVGCPWRFVPRDPRTSKKFMTPAAHSIETASAGAIRAAMRAV